MAAHLSRRATWVLFTLLIVVACLVAGGCGDSETSDPAAGAQTTSEPAKPDDERSSDERSEEVKSIQSETDCLVAAGLSDVENRGSGVWRGFSDDKQLIVVKDLKTASDARRAVRDADLVVSASGGNYFVTGGGNNSETSDETTVRAVAACLDNLT